MHICFASLDYPGSKGGGGVGTYVRTVGRELVRRGHRVSVIDLRRASEAAETDDEGIKVFRIDAGNLHWYVSRIPLIGRIFSLPVRELEYSRAVYNAVRYIDEQDPVDIVEGTETGAYYFYRLRPGIRTVIRLHGEIYTFKKYTIPGHIPCEVRLSRQLQRKALMRAHQLTSPSDAQTSEIVSELRRHCIPPAVVPNPILIDQALLKRRLSPQDRPLFLYVGRLQRVKGVTSLLQAIPRILREMPNACFFFAGNLHPSLPLQEIRRLIDELNISESVKFLGHVSYVRLRTLYEEAAAVVIPSYYETFGYVFLEACMHGAPVVASDVAAIREVYTGDENILLVPPGDSDALAGACVRIARMKPQASPTSHFQRFDTPRVVEELLRIYQTMLRRKDALTPEAVPFCLSPHFDDAVFSCGGILHEYSKQGKKNVVVTLFGGLPDNSALSPFAREIHNKWKLEDPVSMRMNEDKKALATIGAQEMHLDFLDCIYRKTEEGIPLYNDYKSLKGTLHPEDHKLCDDVYEKVKEIIGRYDPGKVEILVPLGIGNHVDHQIAHHVGLRLIAEGFKIYFYEEFPYSAWYSEELKKVGAAHDKRLSPLVVPIDIGAKLRMIKHYKSQLSGIGGNFKTASKNVRKYALTVGNGTYAERVWLPEGEEMRSDLHAVAAIDG